jgi:hypothetical protein
LINNRNKPFKQKIRKKRIKPDINRKYAVIGMIFFIILLISLFTFIFREKNDIKRIIFFPEVNFASEVIEKVYSAEERTMPYLGNMKEDIELYVNEILLGPIRPDHGEIVSKNTEILTLVMDADVLYLNFAGNFFLDNENTILNIGERINTIGSNIKYNFPGLKRIYICVNGQIPDLSAYYGDNTYNFSDGKNYKLENID